MRWPSARSAAAAGRSIARSWSAPARRPQPRINARPSVSRGCHIKSSGTHRPNPRRQLWTFMDLNGLSSQVSGKIPAQPLVPARTAMDRRGRVGAASGAEGLWAPCPLALADAHLLAIAYPIHALSSTIAHDFHSARRATGHRCVASIHNATSVRRNRLTPGGALSHTSAIV